MALVSPSLPIQMRQKRMFLYARESSVRTMSNIVEIEEDRNDDGGDGEEEVEKIHVAVGKEYKESKDVLIWALRYLSKQKMVVLVHIHRPVQKISIMGAKFHVNQLHEDQVRGYREMEKKNMNDTLKDYLRLCSLAKIQADTLVIEMDDVDKGLVELVAQHGVTKLVMGATADRKLKVLKSRTAIRVQKQAEPSCKIWFVGKGNMVLTRDMLQEGAGITVSPIDSLNSSNSNKLKSRSAQQSQTSTPDWLVSAIQRSKSINCDTVSQHNNLHNSMSVYKSNNLCSGGISTDSLARSSNSLHNETLNKEEDSEMNALILPSVHEPERNLELSSPETENSMVDTKINDLKQNALKEAEDLKNEAYIESCRTQKAETDAIAAARKAKASENLYAKELQQRKEVEANLAVEKHELEKLKTHHKELMEELQNAYERTSNMELQIAESQQTTKKNQDKLSQSKILLAALQRELDELQYESTNVFTALEEHTANTGFTGFNFSEFRYEEIKKGTNNFDSSLKIGEGGYGCVYKGLLRNTTVAIKVLNSENMQGKDEFYQEVQILSKVRHQHLVTLIGTCPEAWALVYEYLPNGSLEDRLTCKGNTPPLPWRKRTRIISEICSSLIFLHSYKPHTIVHGDLKTANILLDSNFESKLGDFGISRFLVESNTTETLYKRTNPKGTFGYVDPEFVATGELRPHCDIYSFGLIILRCLTGKPVLRIIKEVKEAMDEDKLEEILDITAGDWPYVQAKRLANLGLRCCDIDRMKRPDLEKDARGVLQPMVRFPAPSYFICPIFQEIMSDPHIAADGYTYEAEAMRGWIESGYGKSPMTNLKLSHHNLVPNRALRFAIEEWLQGQQT